MEVAVIGLGAFFEEVISEFQKRGLRKYNCQSFHEWKSRITWLDTLPYDDIGITETCKILAN